MESLKEKTVNSVFWSGVEKFSAQGAQFVIGLLIARILLPADYGLIAMLTIFIAVAQVFVDSGFGNALIQKQDRNQTDYSTAFYFNIGIAIIVYAVIWLIAPWVAEFYNEPLLTRVMRVVGLNIIISAFSIVHRARLTVVLNFKLQALISLLSVVISGGVGMWMAYAGYGVWALAGQTLLNGFLGTLLLWVMSYWMPSFCFSIESFKKLFGFGSKLLLSGLLHTLYMNLYSLVIGKKYNVIDLGYYNRASAFPVVISGNLVSVISRVTYPIQCEMQDDPERLKASLFRFIRMSCYIIFPLMVGMLVLAKPMVALVLTEKWLPSVPLLQILTFAYMWEILMRMNYDILNVKGRTDYTLQSEVWKKLSAFGILFATLPFGIEALCWGLVLYSWVDLFIITRYTNKLIEVGLWTELKVVFPIILLAGGMGLCVWAVSLLFSSYLLQLIVGVVVGMVFYVSLSILLHLDEFFVVWSSVKSKLHR